MLFVHTRKSRVVALAATIMLAGSLACVGIAQAATDGEAEAAPGVAAAPSVCTGGAQESVQVVTNAAATVRGEGAMANLVGASANYTVPAGDTDLFVVTFSSETNLTGSSNGDNVTVRALLDNVPMSPAGPNTFVQAITAPVQNSATWCARAGAGAHTVQIQWSVTDSGGNNVVTAQVDDTALHLEVSA